MGGDDVGVHHPETRRDGSDQQCGDWLPPNDATTNIYKAACEYFGKLSLAIQRSVDQWHRCICLVLRHDRF